MSTVMNMNHLAGAALGMGAMHYLMHHSQSMQMQAIASAMRRARHIAERHLSMSLESPAIPRTLRMHPTTAHEMRHKDRVASQVEMKLQSHAHHEQITVPPARDYPAPFALMGKVDISDDPFGQIREAGAQRAVREAVASAKLPLA